MHSIIKLRRVNKIRIKKEFLDLLRNIPKYSANKEPSQIANLTNSKTIFFISSLVILGSGLFCHSKKLGQKRILKRR